MKNDKTAYQLAREEGYSTVEYAKLNFKLIAGILLIVYVSVKIAEVVPQPFGGFGAIGFAGWAMVKLIRENEQPKVKRLEGSK